MESSSRYGGFFLPQKSYRKKKGPLARAPFPIVDFLMEVYDTNRRFLEGDAAAAQQLCEVAGKDNGGDGNRYEAADNHGREHFAHEVPSFVRILGEGVAGALGDDRIARESVQGGEAVGQGQRETHLEDFGNNECGDSHSHNTDDNHDQHRADQGLQHVRGAVLQTGEHAQHCGEHEDGVGVRSGQRAGVQEAQSGKDNGNDQAPYDGRNLRNQLAHQAGNPDAQGDFSDNQDRCVVLVRNRRNRLLDVAVITDGGQTDGLHFGDFRLRQVQAAGAPFLDQALSFRVKAKGGDRVAGQTLYAVHGDGENSGLLQTCGGCCLLHGQCRHDAAGEWRKSGDDQGLLHDQRADEPAQRHHAGQTHQADHNGFPLFNQLLQTDYGTDVCDEHQDADGAGEGCQAGIVVQRGRENRPVSDEEQDCGHQHGRNPCFGNVGDPFADNVADAHNHDCQKSIVQNHTLSPF